MTASSPIDTPPAQSHLLPLLKAWSILAAERNAASPVQRQPWWLSYSEQLGSLAEAAQRAGWGVRLPTSPESE